MAASNSIPLSFYFVLFFTTFTSTMIISSHAAVSPSKTFKYVNQGEFGEYTVEYLADYRPLDLYTFPFTLCFYNTTPNAFILALRMGHHRSESIMRWVWEANRGRPVKENATVTFGRDGNLVLADADGSVVWQTGTANKGVVGLDLLQNGNIVLYDKKGKYIWQSFDHPTDTLLVGQTLRFNGPDKIVSRVSPMDGSPGPYSYGLNNLPNIVMYYKSKNSPTPMLYYKSDDFGDGKGSLKTLAFSAQPETEGATAYELYFGYDMNNAPSFGTYILARPKYNATYSMLRVESDGNLRIYTYDENVDWGAWETVYTLFDRSDNYGHPSECGLPKRCGSLGICEESQCIACPRPQGLLAWSKSCAPPSLPPCSAGAKSVDYYKVVGVEHFLNTYSTQGDGPMKLVDCRNKCDKDCSCLGFFYREESSKCLMAPELDTLTLVSNSSHVAYIKISKPK